MTRRHVLMLLALGAIWGASFVPLKVVLRDLDPSTAVAFRVAIGALTLVALLRWLGGRQLLEPMRRRWRGLALAGAMNTAVPFYSLTWGQQYIDTTVASIVNASAPLWTVLLALAFVRSERVTGTRLVGFVAGFAGIVVLIGFEPSGGDRAVVGSLAVCAAAILYAVGALYVSRRLADVPPTGVALGSLLWATVFTAPVGAIELAGEAVGWETWLMLAYLGAAATGVAYLLYFGLIAGAGPARAILVTYLVPSFAIVFGVMLLGEPLTAAAVAGLALVLGGVALGTGAVGPRRRVEPALVEGSP